MTLMNDLAVLVKSLLGENIHSLQPLGEGTDHLAYEVNHAFILRLRRQADAHVEHALRHFWRTFT